VEDGWAEPEFSEGDDSRKYDELLEAWYSSRKIILPEPGDFKIRDIQKAEFSKHFPEGKIQVIVKLANIELTPEKPEYEGGTWHIEGQLVSTYLSQRQNSLLTSLERTHCRIGNLLLRL
jgi:hypothetical protein